MNAETLPPGNQYAVLWGIREDYAGMTASMLRRSHDWVERADAAVTVLTYEHRDDYDPIRETLRGSGGLIDGMDLRNLWEDVRVWSDDILRATLPGDRPEEIGAFEPLGARGQQESELVRRLRDDEGRILQSDYFRPDGTLLVSDRHKGPDGLGRTATLCDTSGEPLKTWPSINKLYYSWLDSLPRNPTAWLVCDSKTSARHLIGYERSDVVKVHVVHGAHRLRPGDETDDRLTARRQRIMENLAAWDAVVFLTDGQRRDAEMLVDEADNLHVIPNEHDVPVAPPALSRNPRAGVMLASLIPRKRVRHAAQAIKKVGRVRGRRVTLDVWGRQPDPEVTEKVEETTTAVRLHGFSRSAVEEFETASFSLLTSKSEAAPGVLIEAMGRGCIPISYDIPFGPADIIDHGVNGFLVPNGDVDALAEQIREVASMPTRDLAPIRLAAHDRAREFRDSLPQWTKLFRQLLPVESRPSKA